ncbi:transcriptional regulator [Pseudomonas sp. StFLB209]|uniref:helix-turn-helix domain-containing protein n=1 Tax=Pseudomonas sp. StFLB209 TaxID=1028989 RepID=UPI0004F6D541|nr:helix-turn-helix transcriptional regulator [Pseudomonas sp. StFLB209]BAP44893.1 transcriptional regulator [Pseudomonas sp. StFLB209]
MTASPPSIDDLIARRIAHLRTQQRLSLAQLAERSGVSKAMISKIERLESSPTAVVLGKLAAGLGIALTELLADDTPDDASRLRRRDEQETWRDPSTGYLRRQVAELDEASGSELVEIDLPAGSRIDYPRWQANAYRQRLWLLEGELQVTYGEQVYQLQSGDHLDFAVDQPVSFVASDTRGCRYLLNILHART